MNDNILTLLQTLGISLLTAYVTVRLSLKQFYSQKWWEKKTEAYSHIIEKLSHVQFCLNRWIDELEGDGMLVAEYKQKLSKDYSEARDALEKVANMGAYIISDKAVKELEKLVIMFYGLSEDEDLYSSFSKCSKEVKDCIYKIRECAKSELSIEKRTFFGL